MSESTTILVKKKKKQVEQKLLTIQEAINILRPFIVKWKRQDEEMANKMYEIYKQCKWGDWTKVLNGLNFPVNTWYAWVEYFKFDLNFPSMSHNGIATERKQSDDVSDAEFEDAVQTECDTVKYQETYNIIHNAMRLSTNMFQVNEKEELLSDLQKLYKKIGALIVKIESGIQ